MIGSGLSIMYVMALVFITELIGENKVSVSKQVLMVSKSLVTVHFQPAIFEIEMTWNFFWMLQNKIQTHPNSLSERNKTLTRS